MAEAGQNLSLLEAQTAYSMLSRAGEAISNPEAG